MHKLLLSTSVGVLALLSFGAANADDLLTLQKDPKQWVSPTGDYANTRYSSLKQITTENVSKLVPAWSFSTGVLRGHEGAPLVLGDVMYVHTPFPNIVLRARPQRRRQDPLEIRARAGSRTSIPVMCCDTVNRGLAYADGKIFLHQADTTLVALDAKTGASRLVGHGWRCRQGPVLHRGAACLQGQGAGRHRWRRIRRARLGHRLQRQGRQVGVARLFRRALTPTL